MAQASGNFIIGCGVISGVACLARFHELRCPDYECPSTPKQAKAQPTPNRAGQRPPHPNSKTHPHPRTYSTTYPPTTSPLLSLPTDTTCNVILIQLHCLSVSRISPSLSTYNRHPLLPNCLDAPSTLLIPRCYPVTRSEAYLNSLSSCLSHGFYLPISQPLLISSRTFVESPFHRLLEHFSA